VKTRVGATVSQAVAFFMPDLPPPTQPTLDPSLVQLRIHGQQAPDPSGLEAEISGSNSD
jgi:hypothetical protein